MSDDGSIIDLRNIPPASSVSAAGSQSVSGVSGGSTASTGQSTTVDPVVVTPLVDPKIAEEFGLDSAQLTELSKKYSIPESVKSKYPDLVALLIKTESMNDEERDYWFQVLPIMSEDQIVKLRTILVNERDQLKKIDTEYEQEIQKLNQVHKNDWNAFEIQQKKAAIKQAESLHEEQEQQSEEALLGKLDDIDGK